MLSSNELVPTPSKLEDLPHGRFSGSLGTYNVQAWDKRRGSRRLQRKAWVFGGAYSSEGSVGFAIADVGYGAVAFCYYYDRHSHYPCFVEEDATVPFYFPKNFQPSLEQTWNLKSGKREWNIESKDDAWHFRFKGQRLDLSFELKHSFPGISAISQSGNRPFHYTYKLAAIPAKVQVSVDDGEKHSWTGSCGAFDFSLGYPARRTFWNWGSFTGKTEDGVSVGINIVNPFNDGLENALWLDGKLIPLSQVRFDYKTPVNENPWHIESLDGRLSLEFYPEAEHKRNSNFFILRSQFKQGIGHFSGTWRDGDRSIRILGCGVVEEHFALW